jgi:hypothetical protein
MLLRYSPTKKQILTNQKTNHMNKLTYIAAVLTAVLALGLSQAHATPSVTFESDYGQANPDISSFPGPYAHLSISLSGQIASFTFTSNTNGGFTYLFGGNKGLGFEVNSTAFTVGTLTGFRTGGFTGTLTSTFDAAGNIGGFNGFGTYNFAINDTDGFGDAYDKLTFTLTNTGTPWLTANDVLTLNAANFDSAGHVFVAQLVNGVYVSEGGITGKAAEGPGGVPVPDGGSTVMLLGLGMSALGLARRFLKI